MSIQATYFGTNRFNASPKIKVPIQAQLNTAKNAEQTCTKFAVSVHAFSTPSVGECLCVHRSFERLFPF